MKEPGIGAELVEEGYVVADLQTSTAYSHLKSAAPLGHNPQVTAKKSS